jgi:MoxR-like ATPase
MPWRSPTPFFRAGFHQELHLSQAPTTPPSLSASAAADRDSQFIQKFTGVKTQILKELHKIIIGQEDVIELLMAAMFARGHCLLVGVPGLAKTLMISTFSKVLKLNFNRIQFTPDLMPSDITGTDILEEDQTTGKRNFRFVKGPVFANIVLADEINRTPPKTQAALLQAMQEYHVTAGGHTYPLELPFFVLATQNPVEQEGTYPLPEAQLDRFMFMVNIGYPSKKEERQIVRATTMELEADPEAILSANDIVHIQKVLRKLPVSDHVVDYAVSLTRATRPKEPNAPQFINDWLTWGAGPRAAQYLVLGAKARAIMSGRLNVSCEDVRRVAKPVLRHRLFTNFNADAEGIGPDQVIEKLIETVPEAGGQEYGS